MIRRRPSGILVEDHPIAGRIPRLTRPVALALPDGAMIATGPDRHRLIAEQCAREGMAVPLQTWGRLRGDEARELFRRGARPTIAGGGRNQPSYRAAGALFALSTTAKTHIYLVSSVTSGQQPYALTFLESSNDGTTGNWTITMEGSTHATAGTAGTAPTVTQIGRYGPVVASATATGGVIGGNYTAEPTALQVFGALIIPLPTAPWAVQYPLGREVDANGTASAIMRGIAHRGVMSVGTPNMRTTIEIEE
jgi:hypothetical protein